MVEITESQLARENCPGAEQLRLRVLVHMRRANAPDDARVTRIHEHIHVAAQLHPRREQVLHLRHAQRRRAVYI